MVPRPRSKPISEVTRPRPRPKFWPRRQFGLEALTSLVIIAHKKVDISQLVSSQRAQTSAKAKISRESCSRGRVFRGEETWGHCC